MERLAIWRCVSGVGRQCVKTQGLRLSFPRVRPIDLGVNEVRPPDCHHVNAAVGWLELGNAVEAAAELQKVSPGLRRQPAVLEVAWRVHAGLKQWEASLEAARQLVDVAPNEPAGWINEAYSLHELKRTHEAMGRLLQASGRFPGVPTVPYNLACYACQLGQKDIAWKWLEKAVNLLGREEVKRMAQGDPDLEPMRGLIEAL